MKRYLVIGARGQLGSDLMRAGERFQATIELVPLTRDHIDITDSGHVRRVLRELAFDGIINCASYHRVDEVEARATEAAAVNAHGIKTLAEVCASKEVRLLHLSTDYVFDGHADRPYTEDAAIGPLNVYGATKALGEKMASEMHRDVVIFRVASLFGVAGPSGKAGNFVDTMLQLGSEGRALRVINDQFMSPTGTADVAWMILSALEHQVPPGIYHAVNSGVASWHEFAEKIFELAGLDVSPQPVPAADYPQTALRPRYSALANDRLAKFVGDIPHWNDALERYLMEKGYGQQGAASRRHGNREGRMPE